MRLDLTEARVQVSGPSSLSLSYMLHAERGEEEEEVGREEVGVIYVLYKMSGAG